MAAKTRAIRELQQRGIEFSVHEYEAGESDVSYGEAVAVALGVAPERLFKTLVARVDDRVVVAIVPVSGRLSLKKLARAMDGKRAALVTTDEAERATGYVVGGISPFAQRKRLPVAVDDSVRNHATIYISAGVRGRQIEVAPDELIGVINARVADLAE